MRRCWAWQSMAGIREEAKPYGMSGYCTECKKWGRHIPAGEGLGMAGIREAVKPYGMAVQTAA